MSDYSRVGVDVREADLGIARITEQIKRTWPAAGFGKVQMDIGYFANVIDFGGIGLATTTDGVGSKTMIADLMGIWTTIGIDCVAMNVNDLICVGAKPVSMVDYIAIEFANQDVLADIGAGLTEGALQAGISITGGEISQLPEMVDGFDLVGTAFGSVPLDKIIDGSAVRPGDIIIGLPSNGIHSNGLTLARKTLDVGLYGPDEIRDDLEGRSIGEELLQPTFIYVREILDLIEKIPVHALINITGDGLLNLNRVNTTGVGFSIDHLLPRPPIFNLIQERSDQISDATMFQTFNMGVGFCVIVSPNDANEALEILHKHGRKAEAIGSVVTDEHKSVLIQQYRLLGRGKSFHRI